MKKLTLGFLALAAALAITPIASADTIQTYGFSFTAGAATSPMTPPLVRSQPYPEPSMTGRTDFLALPEQSKPALPLDSPSILRLFSTTTR